MKSFLTFLLFLSLISIDAFASGFTDGGSDTQCSLAQTQGGDAWPWSVAQPFPWNNIEGYWKLGDQDDTSYVKAVVTSTTNKRKILKLSAYTDGFCSKPIAKGTGYIDATEKNVVRSLLSDGVYRYQLMMGMFDMRDLTGKMTCTENVIAVSMQVIGRAKKAGEPNLGPLDPTITETQNMLLKKVTVNVDELCKNIK